MTIASFDIAFAKIGVLHQNVNYALEGFDADPETMQHVLKVRFCHSRYE